MPGGANGGDGEVGRRPGRGHEGKGDTLEGEGSIRGGCEEEEVGGWCADTVMTECGIFFVGAVQSECGCRSKQNA